MSELGKRSRHTYYIISYLLNTRR